MQKPVTSIHNNEEIKQKYDYLILQIPHNKLKVKLAKYNILIKLSATTRRAQKPELTQRHVEQTVMHGSPIQR